MSHTQHIPKPQNEHFIRSPLYSMHLLYIPTHPKKTIRHYHNSQKNIQRKTPYAIHENLSYHYTYIYNLKYYHFILQEHTHTQHTLPITILFLHSLFHIHNHIKPPIFRSFTPLQSSQLPFTQPHT